MYSTTQRTAKSTEPSLKGSFGPQRKKWTQPLKEGEASTYKDFEREMDF